ncbi:Cytochrome c oxidase subunit VIa, partial [Trinorchestia longiramus]
GMKQWRLASYLVAFPAVALCMVNAYLSHEDHGRPEFIPYEHLRIRTKRFPWGDGQKSLFHNPHVNALPDGYEDVD